MRRPLPALISQPYYWYTDQRKYGTCERARFSGSVVRLRRADGGYGLGVERLLAWLLARWTVKECSLYPVRARPGSGSVTNSAAIHGALQSLRSQGPGEGHAPLSHCARMPRFPVACITAKRASPVPCERARKRAEGGGKSRARRDHGTIFSRSRLRGSGLVFARAVPAAWLACLCLPFRPPFIFAHCLLSEAPPSGAPVASS